MTFYSIVYGVLGVVLGALTDRYGPRLPVTIGAVLLGLGGVIMWKVGALWELYVCYGFFLGGAGGTSWVPLSTSASRWFVRNRGLAVGIVAAGSGMASVLAAPLTTYLVQGFGWRNAYLILGIIAVATVGLLAQFLRHSPKSFGVDIPASELAPVASRRHSARHKPEFTLRQAMRTTQFWLLFAIFGISGIAFVIPLIHTVAYATDLGLSAAEAATVMVFLGIGSIFSRVLIGMIVDWLGAKNVLVASLIFQMAVMLCFIVARNAPGLYAVGFMYGAAYGASVTTMPALTSELFGVVSLGAIFGVAYFSSGLGQAIGPPAAGYIYDGTKSYELAFIAGAALVFLAALLTVLVKMPRTETEAAVAAAEEAR